MNPSFDLVETKAQGEEVKKIITNMRRDLNVKNTNLTFRAENSDRAIADRNSDIQDLQTAVSARQTEIDTETDAEKKEDLITDQLDDQLRLRKLVRAKGKSNVLNLIGWELNQDLVENQMQRLNIHETAINARIADLPA
jgi:hypothetical protein